MNIVNMKNINKNFGEMKVLSDVSLKVKKGEIISIIGPSGSGKSTLLRCLIGLEKIDTGIIEIESEKNTNKKYSSLGMVFQNFNLFPHKTVLDNVIEGLVVVKKIKKYEAVKIGEELLDRVGLLDKKNSYPSQISGGQKQRVAIARALAMKPDIMLFDEPTSALDPELVKEVLNVIKDLVKEHITMIIVTHEIAFAKEISNRIIFMDNGRIVEDASPEKIFVNSQNPRIRMFLEHVL